MADPFLAEIRMMGCNFAPKGWAFCNGQVLPISQNTALFSLLGTTYGGDGITAFALPDLQGRAPMQAGQGPGLSARDLGEKQGTETVTLSIAQIPAHTHPKATQTVRNAPATQKSPVGNIPAIESTDVTATYVDDTVPPGQTGGLTSTAGGGVPHNNMQPYLALNFVIALQGIFPSRP